MQFDLLQEFAIHHSVQFRNDTTVKPTKNNMKLEWKRQIYIWRKQIVLNDDQVKI